MTKEAEQFTLKLTGELKEQLEKSRRRMGVSLNVLVVQILWDWAERQGNLSAIRRFDAGGENVGIY